MFIDPSRYIPTLPAHPCEDCGRVKIAGSQRRCVRCKDLRLIARANRRTRLCPSCGMATMTRPCRTCVSIAVRAQRYAR